jgi:hypothetical protein
VLVKKRIGFADPFAAAEELGRQHVAVHPVRRRHVIAIARQV